MNFLNFFKNKKQCKHEKVSPGEDICYCPDCGELIENRWFITRCCCCGVKLKAIFKNGKVVPEEKFCHNCGGKRYDVELVPKINFIDINYAVLVKTIIEPRIADMTQTWIDMHEHLNIKLLTQT